LLPTPAAQESGQTPEYHAEMKRSMDGGPRQTVTSLSVMARQAEQTGVWSNALLPTPTKGDGEGGGVRSDMTWDRVHRSTGDGGASRLRDVVALLLPTPQTQPTTGNGHARNLGSETREQNWGDYAAAIARHAAVTGRPAPAPTVDGRLNPAFVEWMMMCPEGWVTDPALGLSRTAQLRLLGNTVVWPQAVAAWASLLGVQVDTHTHTPEPDAADTPHLGRQRQRQPRRRGSGLEDGDPMPLIPTPTAWLGRRPSQAAGDPARWLDPARSRELSDFLAWMETR
jgi:DNA (cytosine-5)-methyltransferase 1